MLRQYLKFIFTSAAYCLFTNSERESFRSQGSESIPTLTDRVHCSTTKGDLLIEIYREWSPLGADRFIELVKDGFFSDIAFYRSVDGFLTQFGISDKPEYKHWHGAVIPDDPNLHIGIKKNYLSFAGGGKNSRSSQLFIAFEDLDFLGKEPWETPFGIVVDSQDTIDSIYKGYEDIPPFAKGPDQQKLYNLGNSYLHTDFPLLDYILNCDLLKQQDDKREDVGEYSFHQHDSAGIHGDDAQNIVEDRDVEVPTYKEKLTSSPMETSTTAALNKQRQHDNKAVSTAIAAVSVLGILLFLLYGLHLSRKAAAVDKRTN